MFGMFGSDLKRVRKLRLEFEDIRQRVLLKMNPYQQYSFISGHQAIADEYRETLDSISKDDHARWLQVGGELKVLAQQGWNHFGKMPGIAGEGGSAGAEGVALLALRCLANGYSLAEAQTLKMDIEAFASQATKFLELNSRA